MVSREDISNFLKDNKAIETRSEVLESFVVFCVSNDIPTQKIGKLISDLESYKDWIWNA